MISRSEAIKNLLMKTATDYNRDLAEKYELGLECQVNVAQDNGTRIEGNYQGKGWHGWTDGLQTWKSFRIPYEAKNKPHYDNPAMNFDLAAHAEGIGMTGWNWKDLQSKWVAFDFDSIVGHKEGLTDQQLKEILEKAQNIPWVTIRRSTSGKGFHLYVYLEGERTENHTEHAALARAIIGKMTAITGFDFDAAVDTCGGNIWVWHRKSKGTNGYELLKKGEVLKKSDIPLNWRDHLSVVQGKRKKVKPQFTADQPVDIFEQIAGQHAIVPLDDEHKKLIKFLEEYGLTNWWDSDHHMLVTHTYHLKRAHLELGFKGIFETTSTGTTPHNCFCFALGDGAWVVRRYSQGVQEHALWDQDASGWTRCYFNRAPDLRTLARVYDGVENDKHAYDFKKNGVARLKIALKHLKIDLKLPESFDNRPAQLTTHTDGRLKILVKREDADGELPEWNEKKGWWYRFFNQQNKQLNEEVHLEKIDTYVRHLVNEKYENSGWVIKSEKNWLEEPLTHVTKTLEKDNFNKKQINDILGDSILRFWKLVNAPFQPEYPGDRQWNRDAAQLKFLPSDKDLENLKYDTWLKVLAHLGTGLNEVISKNDWCKENAIVSGADYLKCWYASILQKPSEPLPYLFFFGEQNTGKSLFHEAFELLITKGVVRADNALINQSGFNSELANAILCVIEECDLSVAGTIAYNRIKDWTTARMLPIHGKGGTPYTIRNTTHWVQCANNPKACPIFKGDTRITMIYVEPLKEIIPKSDLLHLLEQEAPDFIRSLLSLEIPKSKDRLMLPVLTTTEKEKQAEVNETVLEHFIKEFCHYNPGAMLPFSEFYETFLDKIEPMERSQWSKIRVGREIPNPYIKGRSPKNCQFYIGNMSWEKPENTDGQKLILRDGKLHGGNL